MREGVIFFMHINWVFEKHNDLVRKDVQIEVAYISQKLLLHLQSVEIIILYVSEYSANAYLLADKGLDPFTDMSD